MVQQDYPRFDIMAVDDGSTDETRNIITSFPRVKLIHQTNQGAAAARNHAFAASKGEILLLLDSDAKVFPGWIQEHVALQKKGHRVVGGSVIPWNDTFWGFCDYYSTWYEYYPQKPFDRNRWQISSTNLSLHRSVIERAGVFDIRLKRTCEDAEYCNRLQKMGIKIAFSPHPTMAHHDRETLGGFLLHHHTYGYMAPFFRTRESGARYGWLVPQNEWKALAMIPLLAILHTGFVMRHWLPRRPESILFLPFIFLSKVAHAIGVYDGVKAKRREKK